MPKNKTGGSGHKKARRGNRNVVGEFNLDEGDCYAKVIKIEGSNRMSAKLHTGQTEQVKIPGRYVRRVWVRTGDIICCREGEMRWKVESAGEMSKAEALFRTNGDGDDTVFANTEEVESDNDDDEFRKMVQKKSSSREKSASKSSDGDIDVDAI